MVMSKKGAASTRRDTKKLQSLRKHARQFVRAHHELSSKTLALKPHHARPFRKHHVSILAASLIACFVLFGFAISWTVMTNIGRQEAIDLFGGLIQLQPSKQAVSSTLGFTFSYSPGQFYIGAINAADGKLYVGKEVSTARAYQTFKLSSSALKDVTQPASITIDYLPGQLQPGEPIRDVEDQYVVASVSATGRPSRVSSGQQVIGGQVFVRTLWKQPVSGVFAQQLSVQFVTYTAIWQGKALVVRTDNRIAAAQAFGDVDVLMRTFALHPTQTSFTQPQSVIVLAAANRSVLDSQIYAHLAAAAAPSQPSTSQLISALYSPAVVKIYNAYCTDILISGKLFVRDYCDALTGSGFFVSEDGYIATNGHVATSNPKDIALESAIAEIYNNGDTSYLYALAIFAGLSDSQLHSTKDASKLFDMICNAVYELPDNMFTESKHVSNLLVDLTDTDPDITKLLADTNAIKSYPGSATIKHATLTGADYRALDGLVKYRQSDVALIKIDGSNYPVVSLGSINDISQGSNLSILGYPGAAQGNGLVSATQDSVTLTSGKVSAIKNANGDTHKLIQTDTTIGHGNSGGPAMDDDGNVVGIATYTIDQSGSGGGVFNYVRDIADLKALATQQGVTITTQGELQQAWQQGITAFYSSHYSKSLTYFNTVKSLYPGHPTADTFIADANEAIKEGKDIVDFPIAVVFVASAICLVIAAAAVLFIIRHHARHKVYQVMTGKAGVRPAGFGAQQPFPVTIPGSFTPQYQQPPMPVPPASPLPLYPQPLSQQQPMAMPAQPVVSPSADVTLQQVPQTTDPGIPPTPPQPSLPLTPLQATRPMTPAQQPMENVYAPSPPLQQPVTPQVFYPQTQPQPPESQPPRSPWS